MEKLTIVIQDAPYGSEKAYNALRYASALLVLLGLQVFSQFDPLLTGVLLVLAALFSWRVYKTPIRYGWI